MRIFAISDLHVDYDVNAEWVAGLSSADYRDDVLILAGDVTDTLRLLEWCLSTLARRFKKVLFVPGNHDLWVTRDARDRDSLQKFADVAAVVASSGVSMQPFRERDVSIIPLLGWYDYSFGEPSEELRSVWSDYYTCRWPSGYGAAEITAHFAALNRQHLAHGRAGREQSGSGAATVITFSHFLPRIDLMPQFIPVAKQFLYPVLGAAQLDRQLRLFNPKIHVYGHSHVNRSIEIDGVLYVNNAFGYPNETWTASKRMLCIHECH
jgi:predicted phosphodiesterase